MAKQIQLRRGTAAEHTTFTGAAGEVTVVTDDDTLRVHDGVTAGGNAVQSGVIGVDIQAYDADTTKNDVTNTFTLSQRGTQTVDNDGSFDMNVTNRFKCTPTIAFTLTFTNIASQGGSIILDNTAGVTISAATTTKVDSTLLATISTAGVYVVSYESDGTNVYVTGSQGLA